MKHRIMMLFICVLVAMISSPQIIVKAEDTIGVISDVDTSEDDSGSGNWLVKLGKLLLDIPAAIVAFIVGFSGVTSAIKGLLQVLFPFLPGLVINIFIVMLYFMVALAVWKLIK